MRQAVQPASGGPVRVLEVPRPVIGPTDVLVQTVASVVSPGTERAVTELARSSLVAKARARPDLVRQVMAKARRDGLAQTARAVRSRLDSDVPVGYSASGIAVEVGEAVTGVSPGQLVATAGAGRANHAEFQSVPGLLCAAVPDGVEPSDAAFATLGAIALHGLRLADVGPGANVVVVGLGLVGQLAVRLAQAAGCNVAGIDVASSAVAKAHRSGALALMEAGEETTKAVLEWSRGRGADAVLVAAATPSSSVMERAPELCRDRAQVVVIGDVGLALDRRRFYERELTLRFARSYGPGRHELAYEEWGVDYPAGLVRWTEGRNLEAVLDLMAGGRLAVADLVTHRFSLDEAPRAYELVEHSTEPVLGVMFSYASALPDDRPVALRRRLLTAATPGVGLVGAGAFASTVLVPSLKAAGFERLVSVASASGLSARRLAEGAGFEKAVSGAGAVIDDPDVDVVIIATPHDTHAKLAARALRAGKHVWCEKPLALSIEELDDVEAARAEGDGVLFVGFNRRWSRGIDALRRHFAGATGPLVVTYRVNAGTLASGHWYRDRRQGGRLLGEVCHFVDTCATIVGGDAVHVQAVGTSETGRELLLADDIVVTLGYGDGSVAAISYASGGHPRTEKERVEVLGRSRSAVLVDFKDLWLDGKKAPLDHPGKGHEEAMTAFMRAVAHGGAEGVVEPFFASTRTTLTAAAGLSRGGVAPT